MKYLWFIIPALLLCGLIQIIDPPIEPQEVDAVGLMNVIISGSGGGSGGGAGDYTEQVTDTFSDSNTPPGGWTEADASSFTENSTEMYRDTNSQPNAFIIFNTQITSADHYVCVKIADIRASGVPGLVFRLTDTDPGTSGDEYYIIRNNTAGTDLDFRNCDSEPASCNTFHDETGYGNWSDNDIVCAAVEGTNASTVFYFWQNPADDPPLKSNATYTINSGNWDAAPSQYANTGQYVGIADMASAIGSITDFDDFSAGPD